MKRAVMIFVMVLLVVALPATIFLVMRNQELRKRAAPATTLSLSPSSVNTAVGQEFTLDVRMDTATNQIVAVEINLTYDPEIIQAEWIHNGTMFPNILNSGVVGNGNVSIALGATNTTTPITGTGTVATVKFTAIAPTQSPISIRFAQDTFVGALNEGSTNALTSSVPATVTIGGTGTSNTESTVTPTPTGSAGLNPTPTATPASFLTPTLTPTGSASDSATSSAVTILSPQRNQSVSSTQPTIQGTAAPGSTITIVIHSSQEITATVIADAYGNWSYTVEQPLESGPHTINVVSQDPSSGGTRTATLAFVVASPSQIESSQSAIPVSGAFENTLLLLGIGILCIISGALLPAVVQKIP